MRDNTLSKAARWALVSSLLLLPAIGHAQDTATIDSPALGVTGSTLLPGGSRALGLGVELGSTTGLTMKYYLAENHALELGVGAGWVGGGAFQTDLSYLYHIYLTETYNFSLPLYVGAGLRATIWPDEGNFVGGDIEDEGNIGLGVFAPVGVAMNFQPLPFDVFAEANFGIGFVPDGVEGGFLIDGTAGARFYF